MNKYAKTIIITDSAREIINNHKHVEIYIARYRDDREDQICCRIGSYVYADYGILELNDVKAMWNRYLDDGDIETLNHDLIAYLDDYYYSDLIDTCNDEIEKSHAGRANEVYTLDDDDNDNIEIKATLYSIN